MNRISKYIALILSAMAIHSCSYDYEMPDFSNAAPTYSVSGVSEELCQVLIEDAKEYGLTFKYAGEHWRTIVRERDEHGNILYEGEPRGKADKNATMLQVSYICSCRLQTANWNYYDICQFDFQKDFKLEISPYTCEARLTSGDTYTKKIADNHPYTYNVDRSNLPTIDKAESLGCSIADVIMYITEKDEAGNQIKRFQHITIDGNIITVGAKYIDVEVEIYGFQNYHNMVVIGKYYFTNISLAEINNTTLYLSTEMEHEFYLLLEGYTYNVDRSNLPVIDKAESLGYSIADVIMYITEKDEAGNQRKRFRHRTIDGNIVTVGAKYIDVEVELYGFQNNYNQVVIGRYYFTNISLAEINNTTLYLSTEMEHEFYLPSEGYTYNIGRGNFTPILSAKVEELGLHIGDTKMYITEKDRQKNALKTFPHEWLDGNIFTSNAEYIDVAIRLYKDEEVKGSFVFRDIKLSGINNSTLELTTDMEYQYVSGS